MTKEVTNRQFAHENKEFQDACSKADIPPTKRQAQKFRHKKGKAWKSRNLGDSNEL